MTESVSLPAADARDSHPSPSVLERFMFSELEEGERQAVSRHLAGCEKCSSITARLWNHGGRGMISLIEMLAKPEMRPARRRRPGRPKKWDPRMSAAVAFLERVARDLMREYAQELERLRDRLEILAAGLLRIPMGDPERISSAEHLQAAISCVLQDNVRPAIAGLRVAADSTAEPEDEEAATA